jgi:hypothetical protein
MAPPQAIPSGRQAAKEFPMQPFSTDKSAQVSQNNAEVTSAPAEQPAPALAFTPLDPKSRTPGLVVRTQLKAGYLKVSYKE